MTDHLDTVLEVLGLVMVFAGVMIVAGVGWALIVAGVLVLVQGVAFGVVTEDDE